MSLKSKFVSVFASGLVLGSFAIVASAQSSDSTTPPAAKMGTEKAAGHEGRGFRRHGGFGKGMRGGDGFRGMRGLMGVELTDAQKTQIKQIHEANRPDQATMDELKAIHEARRSGTELTDDQKARVKTLRDQMRTRAESVNQQVLAILTPEQRQQIETRKAEMEKRREEHRQMREQKRQALPPATTNKSTDN